MEDVDLDAWSGVTDIGPNHVTLTTSYTESISTIATPRVNWNMLVNRHPPTLYQPGLHVTGFCKLFPRPPLLSSDATCSNLSPPLGTFTIYLQPAKIYSAIKLFKILKMSESNCVGWSRVVALTLAPYAIFGLVHAIMMCRLPPLTHSIQLACYFLRRPSSKPPLSSKFLIGMSVTEILFLLSEFYSPPPPPTVPYNIYIDPPIFSGS